MCIELAMLAPFCLFIWDLWNYHEFRNLTSLFQSGTEHVCHFLIFIFLQNHSLLLWILELSGSKFLRPSSHFVCVMCFLRQSCCVILAVLKLKVLLPWTPEFWDCWHTMGPLKDYCCFFCCSISGNLKKYWHFCLDSLSHSLSKFTFCLVLS